MNWKTTLKEHYETAKDFTMFLIRRAKNDTILRVASSLSYTSLIALVPLFAIALAIFSAFPVFADIRAQLQEELFKTVAPSMEENISNYFNGFVQATAKLTTFGVVGIAVTAIMLLSTIENSLNFIFKVTRPRRFATKITLYWTVITLGPLLLGAAFSLRGYFAIDNSVEGIGRIISGFVPSLITMLVLTLVYTLVPNKPVKPLNALGGAFTTVIIFAILRRFFTMFVLNGATYKTLYGAMAVLPIFLVWMYLCWAVVIFGAVVTAALEDYQNPDNNHLKNKHNIKYKK